MNELLTQIDKPDYNIKEVTFIDSEIKAVLYWIINILDHHLSEILSKGINRNRKERRRNKELIEFIIEDWWK